MTGALNNNQLLKKEKLEKKIEKNLSRLHAYVDLPTFFLEKYFLNKYETENRI